MRGTPSLGLSDWGSFRQAEFSDDGGGGTEKEDLGETDDLFSEPCVLLLNLEGSGGRCDSVLSRLVETVLLRNSILFRAVRSKTFFSV
jgi:hypothetical protein